MKRSLLAVFAHPDDETTVGPLLARYAAEGHDVHLVSITSGQKGFRPHFGVEAGGELGRVREEELRCSARSLGIREPHLLGFEDQGISSPRAAGEVASRLRDLIGRTRADVVITWGPDGITLHPDHCAASSIVTSVFQEQGLLLCRPAKLYYVAFPESRLAGNRDPLGRRHAFLTVSDEFITTEVDCRNYLDAGLAAIRCHRTQWTDERMDQIHRIYARAFDGRVFLRLALSRLRPETRETCVLEGFA